MVDFALSSVARSTGVSRYTCFTTGGTAKHRVDQYMVLFYYCSLGGDTAMPGGLDARLCEVYIANVIKLEKRSRMHCLCNICRLLVARTTHSHHRLFFSFFSVGLTPQFSDWLRYISAGYELGFAELF